MGRGPAGIPKKKARKEPKPGQWYWDLVNAKAMIAVDISTPAARRKLAMIRRHNKERK
jgi:hypothetical protein